MARRIVDGPFVLPTGRQWPPPQPLPRLFVPIISINHLSQYQGDPYIDTNLSLDDQALLLNSSFISREEKLLLDQSITEPDVFGPLVNKLHSTLYNLAQRPPCEVLLYLSGHGTNPRNIGDERYVPRNSKPHPARAAINQAEEEYLQHFYDAYAEDFGGAYRGPSGFVGGEVVCHQRGYIGVLGALGLWCFAHSGQVNGCHHLVIVADCCYSGVWGATLQHIRGSTSGNLRDYRELLARHPVSIQCATRDNEVTHGGVFTPLWCFLNDNPQVVQRYLHDFNASGRQQVQHLQRPTYVSTSDLSPSWKYLNDQDFFTYLHHRKLMELQKDMQRNDNQFSPLVIPSVVAMGRFFPNRSLDDRVWCILNPQPRSIQ